MEGLKKAVESNWWASSCASFSVGFFLDFLLKLMYLASLPEKQSFRQSCDRACDIIVTAFFIKVTLHLISVSFWFCFQLSASIFPRILSFWMWSFIENLHIYRVIFIWYFYRELVMSSWRNGEWIRLVYIYLVGYWFSDIYCWDIVTYIIWIISIILNRKSEKINSRCSYNIHPFMCYPKVYYTYILW